MEQNSQVETISIQAPENFSYEPGQPIVLPKNAIDIRQFAPKEIAEKDYFKKIDSADSLFKTLDGAQSLLGKKPKFSLPASDATDADWTEFLSGLKPEKEDAYDFGDDSALPNEVKGSPEFKAQMKKIFHSANVNPRQAKEIVRQWNEMQIGEFKKSQAAREEADKAFDAMGKEIWGDKKDDMIARGKSILESLVPKERIGLVGKSLEGATNDQLITLALIANTVAEKYMKEDQIPNGRGSGMSKESIRDEARKKAIEYKEISQKNPMDPRLPGLKQEIESAYQKAAL